MRTVDARTPSLSGSSLLVDAAPPDHMSETAQQVWRGVIPVMAETGMLRNVDLLAVEMLCEAYADFATADQELRNNWIMTIRSDGSQIPILSRYTYKIDGFGNRVGSLHPAYAAKRDASNAIRSWLNELGMTPAARARIVGSVHGLAPGDKGGQSEAVPEGGTHVLDDLNAEERESMRQLLMRRVAGSAPIAEDAEVVSEDATP